MIKEIRARLHFSDEMEADLQQIADLHRRSLNEEIMIAVSVYVEKEKSLLSAQAAGDRPCILSIECPPDEEEFRSALESLHSFFGWVQIVEKPNHSFLCAAPKNGLSYDECFILCQQRFGRMHGIGWVYAGVQK